MRLFAGFMSSKKESIVQLVLIAGTLIALNYSANSVLLRLDVTDDQRFTLSEASSDIAENITDPVTVTAYFSSDLPPQLQQSQQQFRYFLEEFRAHSGNNIEYTFVDPGENDASEREAQQAQIQPVLLDVRERDQISQRRAYLGAVFQHGEERETIPVIRPGSGMEYTIASTIKKLTNTNRRSIGILQGHGEPSLIAMSEVAEELRQQYEVVPVSGIDTLGIDPSLAALAVVAPTESFTTEELLAIDQFIMRGGRVLFAINRIQANLQTGTAEENDTGLERLLATYQTRVESDLVLDANSGVIGVRQQQGGFSFVNQVQFPFFPIATNFADHPVTGGLESAIFEFVSTVDALESDTTIQKTVLVSSSRQSGTEQSPFYLDPFREWSEENFRESNLPLAVLTEGSFSSAFANAENLAVDLESGVETAIIVFGDGDFAVTGEGGQQQQLPRDNLSLFLNSIDFLADDTGLVALRSKGITNRPLEMLEDRTRTLLKMINVFSPIVLVLSYGGYRYYRRRGRRQKWMEEGV